MYCIHDQVYIAKKFILIFHLKFTPENRELFALEVESIASEIKRMKLKEQVVPLLHFFGMKCTA